MRASMPTKVGEFLASGRPVVVNAGLGDLEGLLATHDCGVVIDGDSDDALERAADDVERLCADVDTPTRCRALAEAHFDLGTAVTTLIEVYQHALERAG